MSLQKGAKTLHYAKPISRRHEARSVEGLGNQLGMLLPQRRKQAFLLLKGEIIAAIFVLRQFNDFVLEISYLAIKNAALDPSSHVALLRVKRDHGLTGYFLVRFLAALKSSASIYPRALLVREIAQLLRRQMAVFRTHGINKKHLMIGEVLRRAFRPLDNFYLLRMVRKQFGLNWPLDPRLYSTTKKRCVGAHQ